MCQYSSLSPSLSHSQTYTYTHTLIIPVSPNSVIKQKIRHLYITSILNQLNFVIKQRFAYEIIFIKVSAKIYYNITLTGCIKSKNKTNLKIKHLFLLGLFSTQQVGSIPLEGTRCEFLNVLDRLLFKSPFSNRNLTIESPL